MCLIGWGEKSMMYIVNIHICIYAHIIDVYINNAPLGNGSPMHRQCDQLHPKRESESWQVKQEPEPVHCDESGESDFKHGWKGECFIANGTSQSREVAIYLNKNLEYILHEIEKDPYGSFNPWI